MYGLLDQDNQAFLTLDIGQGPREFLIDTGFNGSLVIGEEVFETTDVSDVGVMKAELASHQEFEYRQYLVQFEWFGKAVLARVLVGLGKECLIGTALLDLHRLEIDFGHRTVQLICGANW